MLENKRVLPVHDCTALKSTPLSEDNGKFYLPSSKDPLSDEDLNKHETSIDSWEQTEAQVRELVYNTVDNSIFLQIKGEATAAALWKSCPQSMAIKKLNLKNTY